jgi:hypothetical protein
MQDLPGNPEQASNLSSSPPERRQNILAQQLTGMHRRQSHL